MAFLVFHLKLNVQTIDPTRENGFIFCVHILSGVLLLPYQRNLQQPFLRINQSFIIYPLFQSSPMLLNLVAYTYVFKANWKFVLCYVCCYLSFGCCLFTYSMSTYSLGAVNNFKATYFSIRFQELETTPWICGAVQFWTQLIWILNENSTKTFFFVRIEVKIFFSKVSSFVPFLISHFGRRLECAIYFFVSFFPTFLSYFIHSAVI